MVIDQNTWKRVNCRRCELIHQKYRAGLTTMEQAELDALEEAATKYLEIIAPLPNYPLDTLQAHVDRIQLDAAEDLAEI